MIRSSLNLETLTRIADEYRPKQIEFHATLMDALENGSGNIICIRKPEPHKDRTYYESTENIQ